MIELINESKINSKEYMLIRLEFLDLWNKLYLAKNRIDYRINGFSSLLIPNIKLMLNRLGLYIKLSNKLSDRLITSDVILYSNQLHSVRNWEYPWAVLNSSINKDTKILDIGSGWSLFPLYLAGMSDIVDSIDTDKKQMNKISPILADVLKRNVNYKVGDTLNIPVDDNTYDYVYSISVFEHLEEITSYGKRVNYHFEHLELKALEECLRVVKPNGKVITTIEYGNKNSDKRAFDIEDLQRIYYKFGDKMLNNILDIDKFIFTNGDASDMESLSIKTFPYQKMKRPTGSLGIILKK